MFDKKGKKRLLQRAHKRWNYDKQKFWRTIKPFLTNNGCMSKDFIGIENEGNLICNEQKLVELFNEHYINIVEISSGKKTLVTRKFFIYISR